MLLVEVLVLSSSFYPGDHHLPIIMISIVTHVYFLFCWTKKYQFKLKHYIKTNQDFNTFKVLCSTYYQSGVSFTLEDI